LGKALNGLLLGFEWLDWWKQWQFDSKTEKVTSLSADRCTLKNK